MIASGRFIAFKSAPYIRRAIIQAVEDVQRTLYNVCVPDGEGIESPGEYCCAHFDTVLCGFVWLYGLR